MISCFFHSYAIHRHLDDGEPLPESTTAHIENCSHCRKIAHGQSTVIKALSAPVERTQAPPFLHARIIRALREPRNKPSRNLKTQWAVATCAVAVITTSTGAQRRTGSLVASVANRTYAENFAP
jgi:hypothetical protein